MPTMTRTVDGITQTVVAADAQVTWYRAQGYEVADPTTAPPSAVVYVSQADLEAALAQYVKIGSQQGNPTGVGLDTDGVYFPLASGTVALSQDTDGVYYPLGV